MFLWLRLHGIACADAILARLQAEKVVVVPGEPAPAWCMRLCSGCQVEWLAGPAAKTPPLLVQAGIITVLLSGV